MRVLNDCGDARGGRGAGPGRKILALGITWIHQVYVGIHTARHDEQPRCVDYRAAARYRLADMRDAAV
jgi:hypothetical protein